MEGYVSRAWPFLLSAKGKAVRRIKWSYRKHDKWLAQATWKILLHALCTHNNTEGFLAHDIFDAGNKEVLHEIPWITTNFTSQWCLNIITALRYIREDLPKTMEELEKLLAGLDESGFHKA